MNLLKKWPLVALGCAAAVPFAVACGSKSPPPPQLAQTGSVTATSTACPPGYPGPCVASTQTPTATGSATGAETTTLPSASASAPPSGSASAGPPPLGQVLFDPNALARFLQGLGVPVNPNLTQPGTVPDALEAGLKGQQMRLAPGMTPEGPMLKQTLQQGQHTSIQVPMQQGKCYVVLGWSQPGDVKDLDLYLLQPPLYNTLTAQDTTGHNAPFLGADSRVPPKPMCPMWPVPLQYKLDVFAKEGSGAVAVQVYSKPAQ